VVEVDHYRSASVWPKRLGKILVLALAFYLCYVATNHDYRLVVGERLFIGPPGPPAGPDIFLMHDKSSDGGSKFISGVKAYAMTEGLVVGQFEVGWFIVDGRWSPRLYRVGVGKKENEEDGWYPPHVLYPEGEKERWLKDLARLGLKASPDLLPPRQKGYKRCTLICWAVVAVLGIVWVGKDHQRHLGRRNRDSIGQSPTSGNVAGGSGAEGRDGMG